MSAGALAFANRETPYAPPPVPFYDAVGVPLLRLALRLEGKRRDDLEELLDSWPALSRPAERRDE